MIELSPRAWIKWTAILFKYLMYKRRCRLFVHHALSTYPLDPLSPHILNTPNRVSATSAFSAALKLSARTSRDFAGSMIPSSQSLADE